MAAKVYNIGFKLDGAISSKFTGSMLSASKTVGVLGQKISLLEKSKSKVDRFNALQKEILETKQLFDKAGEESKQLAAELATAENAAQKLGNQFRKADRLTKKLGTSVDAQKTSFAGLKLKMASTNETLQKTKNKLSETQKTSRLLAAEIKATLSPTKELKDRFAAAESETKKLSTSLIAQKTSLAGLKHEMASANQTLQETKKELSEAQKTSRQLSGEFKSAAKSTKTLEGQLAAVAQKGNRLKSSVDKQKTSLSELEREMTSAGIKTGQLTKHNQKLAESLDRARHKQEKLQKIMMKQKAVQNKRSSMQGKLFDAAAMGAMVAAPVMIAAKFEQSMAEVKSLTGATGKDFTALTAKARLLGSTTSFSASEAAQGMKYLGMAGFDTTQIIAAMPGVLNMAKAGATELGTASDIASDIMSGFGLKANEMGRVSDVLTKTFTSSNTSLEMLGETMKYVAPVASKAGMSLEQTAAMAGLLGNVGIKGSMAGTTLKGMVLSIAGQSKGAAIAIGDLGVKTKDAEGNLRPFSAILGDISKATKDMGNAEKLDLVKTIFGKESAAGITELISKAGENGIEEYIKKVRDSGGVAEQIAKVMDNTTVGALKNLGSAAEGLAIVVGNTLTPAITATAKGLAFITRGVTAVAEKFPFATKVVGLLAGGTIALTAAAVGAGYAFTFVSGGLLKAQEMYMLVGDRLKGFTARILENNTVQKLQSAYTLKAQKMYQLLSDHLKGVTARILAHNKVQKAITISTRIMTDATFRAAYAQKFQSICTMKAQEVYQKLNISMKLTTARTIAYSAAQKVTAVSTRIMTAATIGAEHAQKFLSSGVLKAQEIYQKLNISMKLTTARTIAYSAVQKITAAATGIMTAAQWAFNAAMAANPIGLAVMGVAALAAGAVALYRNFEPFKILMDNTWALIKSFGGGVWSGLMEGLEPVISIFSEMKAAMREAFGEMGVAIAAVKESFVTLVAPIKEAFVALVAPLKEVFSAIVAPFKDIFVAIIAPIREVFSAFISPIAEWFSTLITPINESGKAMSGFAIAGKIVGKTFGFILKTVLTPVLLTIKAITIAARVASKVASFFTGKKSNGTINPKVQKIPNIKTAKVIPFAAGTKGKALEMKKSWPKVPEVSRAANAEVIRLQTGLTGGIPETRGLPEVKKATNTSSTSIEYKPQINITATGSNVTEFKAAADQSLMESEERFRKMQADINHDDRRRALG